MWKDFTLDPTVSDRHFLSRAVFTRFVRAQNLEILRFYKHLRRMRVPFVVLGSPPPSHRVFTYFNMPGVSEREFTLIFETIRCIITEEMDELGIHYLLPPDGVSNDGFLREDLASKAKEGDPHGNERYGEIFISHAFRVLDPSHFQLK